MVKTKASNPLLLFSVITLWCFLLVVLSELTFFQESLEAQAPSREFTTFSNLRETILSALEDERQWDYPEIDVVYTWVNGSDPIWLAQKDQHRMAFLADLEHKTIQQIEQEDQATNGANRENRFRDHQELKYSMRSILLHAPWVRYIHVVVADGQAPAWLNVSHPKIRVVPHTSMFTNASHLPVFSSSAIETQLDNIPELSDYFLYLNDDVFLGQTLNQSEFLPHRTSGNQRVFFDFWKAFGTCSGKCSFEMMGDGHCDASCNNPECKFDMGDCGVQATKEGLQHFREQDANQRVFDRNSGHFVKQIKYVDEVFNRELGKTPLTENRRPIAHVPHLINKRLLRDLKQHFTTEFDLTASHRFRHRMDMQFAFSYYHYFVHQGVYAPTKKQIWRAALLTSQKQEPFLYGTNWDPSNTYQQAKRNWIEGSKSYKTLKTCAEALVRENSAMDEAELQRCDKAVEVLNHQHQVRLPIDSLISVSPNDIHLYQHFLSVRGENEQRDLEFLQLPIKSPKQFLCLEDDMSVIHPKIEQGYIELFQTLFPVPSPFELIS